MNSVAQSLRQACNQPDYIYPVVFIFLGSLGDKDKPSGAAVRAVMANQVDSRQILYHPKHSAPTREELLSG